MKRFITFTIIVVLSILTIHAQDVSFKASAKTVVKEGQNFYLKYKLNKKVNHFQLPDLGKFRILRGPSKQRSTSIQIINGKKTSSYSFTYTYIVKAPGKGTYTLNPATAKIEGKTYKSNKLTINVVENKNYDPGQNNQAKKQQKRKSSGSGGAFARLNVNKTEVYEGEPIYASLTIYLPKQNLAGFKDVTFPEFNGFWSEEYSMPEQIQLKRENIGGKNYFAAQIASWILYPQRSGELTISSGKYNIVLRETVSGGNSRSIFDSFFNHYENVPKTLKNKPVKIDVNPLPSAQPTDFSGGIGKFKVSSQLSHDSVDVNEAVNLRIKISGTGNLNLIDEPKLDLPKVFEVYDPEITSNYKQTLNGTQGSIEYDYTIIPRYPDKYTIKPVNISWFDPSEKSYKKYVSDKFNLFVRETKDFNKKEPVAKGDPGNKVNMIAKDIHFLKDIELEKNQGGKFFNSLTYWLFYIIPFTVLSLIIFLRRKQIKERANIAKVRDKKANKIARKRLKKAKKLMDSESQEFYNETIKALWGYVADKLDMDTANLSRESVTEGLKKRGLEDKLTDKLLNIIDKCEYAHFAPAGEETEPQKIYKYAATLIRKLEQKL